MYNSSGDRMAMYMGHVQRNQYSDSASEKLHQMWLKTCGGRSPVDGSTSYSVYAGSRTPEQDQMGYYQSVPYGVSTPHKKRTVCFSGFEDLLSLPKVSHEEVYVDLSTKTDDEMTDDEYFSVYGTRYRFSRVETREECDHDSDEECDCDSDDSFYEKGLVATRSGYTADDFSYEMYDEDSYEGADVDSCYISCDCESSCDCEDDSIDEDEWSFCRACSVGADCDVHVGFQGSDVDQMISVDPLSRVDFSTASCMDDTVCVVDMDKIPIVGDDEFRCLVSDRIQIVGKAINGAGGLDRSTMKDIKGTEELFKKYILGSYETVAVDDYSLYNDIELLLDPVNLLAFLLRLGLNVPLVAGNWEREVKCIWYSIVWAMWDFSDVEDQVCVDALIEQVGLGVYDPRKFKLGDVKVYSFMAELLCSFDPGTRIRIRYKDGIMYLYINKSPFPISFVFPVYDQPDNRELLGSKYRVGYGSIKKIVWLASYQQRLDYVNKQGVLYTGQFKGYTHDLSDFNGRNPIDWGWTSYWKADISVVPLFVMRQDHTYFPDFCKPMAAKFLDGFQNGIHVYVEFVDNYGSPGTMYMCMAASGKCRLGLFIWDELLSLRDQLIFISRGVDGVHATVYQKLLYSGEFSELIAY